MRALLILITLILGWAFKAQAGDFEKALLEYPVVVYVNKATTGPMAQKIIVFVEGQQRILDRVSTGREQFERERFSETPVGFYTPTALIENHVASKSGIEMPYSIFFYKGIALHQAVDQGLYTLGKRASSGCVRLSRQLAPRLFDLVEDYGKGTVPVFNTDGSLSYHNSGEMVKAHRYMTLVIVDNSNKEKPDLFDRIQKAMSR